MSIPYMEWFTFPVEMPEGEECFCSICGERVLLNELVSEDGANGFYIHRNCYEAKIEDAEE